MALEALSNVIKHNRGVDIQCIGHFKLLFSLLRLRRCPKIQEMALQVFFYKFWLLGWVRLTKIWVSGSWILKSQLLSLALVFEKLNFKLF
jgi:hypothetical protein